MKIRYFILFLFVFFLFGCFNSVPKGKFNLTNIPDFNSDSAYNFILQQVMFGPRVPNSSGHDSCADFIVNHLRYYGFSVETQRFTVMRFDSLPMHGINIFASFDTDNSRRILLFTHWDTRFMAENDTDSLSRLRPITGANDGASGAAVMLEIARLLSQYPPQVGVDLLFLDAEDQGPTPFAHLEDFSKYWALGAKYWSENKPLDYKPLWGLGLDLVGAKGAKFAIEDNSLFFYGYLIKKIWQIADTLGYDTIFVDKRTHGLTNDHIILTQIGRIRSVMISENIPGKIYGDYWHTHKDTLSIIDKKVLKAVGQTVITLIYNVK